MVSMLEQIGDLSRDRNFKKDLNGNAGNKNKTVIGEK